MQRWWILLATGTAGIALAALLIAITRGPGPSDLEIAPPAEAPVEATRASPPGLGSAPRAPADRARPGADPAAADRPAPRAAPAPQPQASTPPAERSPYADLPPDKVLINEADAALVAGDSVTADALLITVIDDPATSPPIRAFAQYKRASVLVDLDREDEARELLEAVINAPMGDSTHERWLRDQATQDLAEMR